MFNLSQKPQASQEDSQFFAQGSITQKTLVRIAASVALIVTGATVINYGQLLSTLKTHQLDQLEEYVRERVAREQEIFQLAADDHAILKQEIIRQYQSANAGDLTKEFDRLFARSSDGVIRNRPENFDGKRQAGVYIDKSLPIAAEIRRQVISLKGLIESYGRAWHNRFQSTFVMTPDNITIVYWPEVSTWAQDADANFYMPKQEEYIVANPENNPERKTAWTAPYLEEVSQLWLVTGSTPVDLNDKPIAIIGHDVILNDLIKRTVNNNIDGGYNLIFREDGHSIVHPELMDKVQDRATPYRIPESEDVNLRNIFELVTTAPKQQIIIDNAKDGQYLAVQKISGPDWYFVTVLPKSVLAKQAAGLALFNWSIAAVLLLTLLGVVSVILNNQVAAPLKQLIEATHQIHQGDYHVYIEDNRQDEIGRLAHSFNLMAAEIAARNKELRSALNRQKKLANKVTNNLEKQGTSVQKVTAKMDELSASARASATQASESAMGAKQVLLLIEGDLEESEMSGNYSLKEKVEKLAEEISHLSDQIRRIGMISAVASNLANQTNMLALNAAVEAVRAGENGLGFSVIATEIRKLADRSRTSAAEINALVEEIQMAMNSTVIVTSDSKKALVTVVDAVNNIVINSQKLSQNAYQQSMAISQVLAAMNNLNQIAAEYLNS